MKKIIAFILIISFSLFLGGCFKKEAREAQVNTGSGEIQEEKEDISLLGWLKRGRAVECVLTTPDGEISVKTKGSKVRVDGIPYAFGSGAQSGTAANGASLTDGDWTYFWSGTEGMKMNNRTMAELSPDPEQEDYYKGQQWENMAQEWEKDDSLNYKCEEKTLADDLFTPPADIVFTDLSEMMEQISNIGEDLEKQMESGEPIDMEAMEKAMNELQLE